MGWAYTDCTVNPGAQGCTGSLQFHTGSGGISGSCNLIFHTGSSPNLLALTGNLDVSGTITARNYDVINHTITYLSSSGASKFGDSTDDLHQFTGSVQISGAANSTLFRVDGGATTPVIFATGSGRVAIGHDSPDYTLSVNGYMELGNGFGAGYVISRGDVDTYLRFGVAGTDSMALVAGGKQFITIDNNSTSSNDYIILGTTSTDNTYVSGNLIVCDGTASIAHLSGCSPIQVHAPMHFSAAVDFGPQRTEFGEITISRTAPVSDTLIVASSCSESIYFSGSITASCPTLFESTVTGTVGMDPGGPGTNSIQLGPEAQAIGTRAIALGYQASTNNYLNSGSIAIGFRASVARDEADPTKTPIGVNAGNSSIAIGVFAATDQTADSHYNISLGRAASSSAEASIAIGHNADSWAPASIAIGSAATAKAYAGQPQPTGSIAIGKSAAARADNSIALGSGSLNVTANSFTIGSPTQGMDFNVTGNITLLNNGVAGYGHLNVCQGTASILHLSGCSPIQVHAPMSSSTWISASAFYGDGSGLTGVAAVTDVDDDARYQLVGVAAAGTGVTLTTDDAAPITFNPNKTTLQANGWQYRGAKFAASGSFGPAGSYHGIVSFGDDDTDSVLIIRSKKSGEERLTITNDQGPLLLSGSGVGMRLDSPVKVSDDCSFTFISDATVDIGNQAQGLRTLYTTEMSASGDTYVGNNLFVYNNTAQLWGGLDLNSIGITAAGPIAGATSISGSGAIEGATGRIGEIHFQGDGDVRATEGTFKLGDNDLTTTGTASFGPVTATTVSASLNISASAFYGDGSNLKNLPGGVGGIFKELSTTTAATTSSVAIGTGSAPKITLDVHYIGSGSPVNLVNDTGGGEVVYFGSASAPGLSRGAVYFLNKGGGWQSVDSAATGSGHNQLLGMSLGSKPDEDGVLIKGYFDVDTFYSGSFIKGAPIYIQSSSVGRAVVAGGYLSGAAPSAADSYVRIVGYGTDTANVIYFNPDATYVEIGS